MKRGTLLALIAAGFAGWWLGRQAPEAQLHLGPQPEPGDAPATPESQARDTVESAPATMLQPAEALEPARPSDPNADAGRAMRQARSAVDQRMRTLRARAPKSA